MKRSKESRVRIIVMQFTTLWWNKNLKKEDFRASFSERYPAAKELPDPNDIIFVYSRHVETIILLQRQNP